MSEEGMNSKKKFVGKKKIRNYTKPECQRELERLTSVGDTGSDYRRAVQDRLRELP